MNTQRGVLIMNGSVNNQCKVLLFFFLTFVLNFFFERHNFKMNETKIWFFWWVCEDLNKGCFFIEMRNFKAYFNIIWGEWGFSGIDLKESITDNVWNELVIF